MRRGRCSAAGVALVCGVATVFAPERQALAQEQAPQPVPGQAPAPAVEQNPPQRSADTAASPGAAAPTEAAPTEPAAAEPPPAAASTAESPAGAAAESPQLLDRDELSQPGYVPGYRRYAGLGLSPYSPRVGALPGGLTPGYQAPRPADEWTFKFSGYMTASLQFSVDEREKVQEGQSETVFHTPPETVDEYASFLGTSTVPGNWVNLNFNYGKENVSATVSIDTWNPSRPTTYYQIGSQYFINNAFLQFMLPPIGDLRLRWTVGYFSNNYGGLSRYGNGIYSNAVSGGPTNGIGETTIAEFSISDSVTAVLEHGIMGNRQGKVPDGVVPAPDTSYNNPIFPAAWIHHAHAGLRVKGEPELEFQVHYMTNWSQDDRNRRAVDNPQTRQIDEANLRDGRITVIGADARLSSSTFGYLAAGAAFIDAKDAFTLRGLRTYGGEGEHLTDRWFGVPTSGTGTMWVAAINYSASLGRILTYPDPFPGDGPDLVLNTGFHIARTSTEFQRWDGRVRHKYGLDLLYTFLPFMGVGIRGDRVVPNSKDSAETFHVIAPRIQFKTDWNSHETIQIIYAKWFYGDHTRNEGTGERTPDRLDDQMFALNFSMWW